MKHLGIRSGMYDDAKQRIWKIEKGFRGEGMRLGTLYAISTALEVEATDLMPTNGEVMAMLAAELALDDGEG